MIEEPFIDKIIYINLDKRTYGKTIRKFWINCRKIFCH